jgi:LmbE family N-acetylglucosaminyl deacetylase
VSSSERGPLLVVVAHPDDEALGFAGVVARARAESREVRVAIVTNGDDRALGRLPLRFCGAERGRPARVARFGVRRGRETLSAMELLGLRHSRDPSASDVFLLGYPNYALETIVGSDSAWDGDATGLHRTYAADGGRRCDGDLGYLVRGRHSRLCAEDLAKDLDDLLELTRPSDVYTHVEFDGHPDHAEVNRQIVATVRRRGQAVILHSTLIHPSGTRDRMYKSAYDWPNPAQHEVATPYERFTPLLDFAPPGSGGSWGPLGPPNELVEVPPVMQDPDPATNLKWQVIARYASQINCRAARSDSLHPSCGYLRAFVKRHEFFWTERLAGAECAAPPSGGRPE